MASPRQQRPTYNRRPVRSTTPILAQILAPVVAVIQPATLFLRFLSVARPPDSGGTFTPVVLSGIPEIRRALDSTLATGATLDPDGFTILVTFPGVPLTDTDSFWLGPNDPAIRTTTGGFASPGLISLPSTLPPAHPPATYTAASTGPNEITVVYAGSGGDYTLLNPHGFRLDPANEHPLSTLWSATDSMVLSFTAAVSPGNTLSYEGPYLPVGNASVTTLEPGPVTVT